MAKLFILVDAQKDFFDGSLGFEEAVKLEQKILDKIHEYSKNCEYVICTLDTHHLNYLVTHEGRHLPIEHCIKGTEGWKLYGAIGQAAYEAAAVMIEKNTFPAEGLIEQLHRLNNLERRIDGRGITEIEIAGVVTDKCVISNAIMAKAALPEANIKILSNMCASNDMEAHYRALEIMKGLHMEVVE